MTATMQTLLFMLAVLAAVAVAARRRIEYELDLEEASLANRGSDGGGWI
jgi:hypothetical protein